MAWTALVIAGFLEICWAIGLKYTEGFTKPIPSALTIVAIAAQFLAAFHRHAVDPDWHGLCDLDRHWGGWCGDLWHHYGR